MEKHTIGLFRKIDLDGEIYFQLYDTCESVEEAFIEGAVSTEEFNQNTDRIIHFPLYLDSEDRLELMKFQAIGYIENNKLKAINDDPVLKTNVLREAYKEYGDFDIFPRYVLDEEKIIKRLSKNLYQCDAPIKSLVSLINDTIKISNTHMSKEEKSAIKDNIIVYGPKNSGKSTLLDSLINNANYPIASITLTNDVKENIIDFITTLIVRASLNIDFAQNGIVVIKDNFSEWNKGDPNLEGDPYDYLEQLITISSIIISGSQQMEIDLRNITFILEQNTDNNEDELYNFPEYLNDYFRGRIKVRELTKEDLRGYIYDSSKSPVNIFTKLFRGKREIVLESDAIDYLVKYAMDHEKIKTINNILETAILSEQKKNKIIIISKELLEGIINENKNEIIVRSKREITPIEKKEEQEKSGSMEETEPVVELESEELAEIKPKTGKIKLDYTKIKKENRAKYAYLREYIKGQDEVLQRLLNHIIECDQIQNGDYSIETKKENIDHVLIQGLPGTGKTYITSKILELFEKAGKVYRLEDATKYTEAGYKGEDVENMLINLLKVAGGDLEKAQRGVLIIDEFDKKAEQPNASSDVSRKSVQESLLKIFEGQKCPLTIKKGFNEQHIMFDTRELLIICLGAFEGLDKIRDRRLGISKDGYKPAIGFKTLEEEKLEEEKRMASKKNNIIQSERYTKEDYEAYGLGSQIMRRLNCQLELNVPTKEDYIDVILNSKASKFMIQVEKYRELCDIEWTDDFIDELAERSMKSGYGFSAIGMLTFELFSELSLFFVYSDEAENYSGVRFTKECLDDCKLIQYIKKDNIKEEGKSLTKKI